MTSGVKQAMPAVLMTKTAVEGKAARGRLPQADFAEALGIGKQDGKKSAPMKIDGGDPVTAWPRLATKLGSPFDRVHLKPEVPNEEPGDRSGDDDLSDSQLAERLVEKDGQQPNDFHPTSIAASPIVVPTRQEPSLRTARPAAWPGNKVSGVDPEAELPSAAARATSESTHAGKASTPDNSVPEAPRTVSFVPLRASERLEPQQAQSAQHPQFAASPSEEGKATKNEPVAAEPARAAPRVTVIGQQTVPSPMASTALVLVDSLAASTLLGAPNTTPAPSAIHAAATHASAQSLKIQLHPAELGMVTATLRFAGERLSIELKVENQEAYRRLTSDSDTIVGSLRDLGYDIDKVTVLQSTIVSSSAQRPDLAAPMHSPPSRSGDLSDSVMANGGNAGSGENSPGKGGNPEQRSQKGPSAHPETSDAGLFI